MKLGHSSFPLRAEPPPGHYTPLVAFEIDKRSMGSQTNAAAVDKIKKWSSDRSLSLCLPRILPFRVSIERDLKRLEDRFLESFLCIHISRDISHTSSILQSSRLFPSSCRHKIGLLSSPCGCSFVVRQFLKSTTCCCCFFSASFVAAFLPQLSLSQT